MEDDFFILDSHVVRYLTMEDYRIFSEAYHACKDLPEEAFYKAIYDTIMYSVLRMDDTMSNDVLESSHCSRMSVENIKCLQMALAGWAKSYYERKKFMSGGDSDEKR